jgi:GntR family transcriptional regulator
VRSTGQQVVAKLAINPNTVLKAYRDLEREGLVRARPGLGTFVAKARRAGLGPDDIEAIYRTAYRNAFSEGVA